VREYVDFRVTVASEGRARALFDDEAMAEIGRRTAGTPRLINQVCDRALLIAYAKGADRVVGSHVREAAEELELATLPSSPSAMLYRSFGSEA